MYVKLKENVSVKDLTSFKIGGEVEKLYFPKTQQEFIYLLTKLNSPLIFGNWSNVLISSKGIKKSVISTSELNNIEIEDTVITADCGVKGPALAKVAADNDLSGFEFMSGFPGSIGGNIYMNASAHAQSISDFLVSIDVFDIRKKEVLTIERKILSFSYRSSILQRRPYILLSAKFDLPRADKKQILDVIKKNLLFRRTYQPNLSKPNAGSVFKNPEDQSAGRLLDKAGVKNLRVGGAKVWKKHANFIVNTGDATSSDVLELMYQMYTAVKDKYMIKLEPEVKFFGERTAREDFICRILYDQ